MNDVHKYAHLFHCFVYQDEYKGCCRYIDWKSESTFILRLTPLSGDSVIFSLHLTIMPDPKVCYVEIATSSEGDNLRNFARTRQLFKWLGISEILYKRETDENSQIKSMRI